MGQTCSCDKDQDIITDNQMFNPNLVEVPKEIKQSENRVKSIYHSTPEPLISGLSTNNSRVFMMDSHVSTLANKSSLNNYKDGKYEGETKNGLPHGSGKMQYANGDEFVGNFINGKKCGYGVLYRFNQFTYRGNFDNDQMNGLGILEETNGKIQKGMFEKGIYVGK